MTNLEYELSKFIRIYVCILKKINGQYYQLLEANNGKTGLSIEFDDVPDLVISDIMIHRLDGISLCHQIKIDDRTSHIVVILHAVKSTQDDRPKGPLIKGS